MPPLTIWWGGALLNLSGDWGEGSPGLGERPEQAPPPGKAALPSAPGCGHGHCRDHKGTNMGLPAVMRCVATPGDPRSLSGQGLPDGTPTLSQAVGSPEGRFRQGQRATGLPAWSTWPKYHPQPGML